MNGKSMFESKHEGLIPFRIFLSRLGRSIGVSIAIVVFSLILGGLGYHYFGDLPWVDAFLNASMILTGMGPVDPMRSTGGKVFATLYALYSGIAFLTMMAVVLAPVLHRFLHKFHLEDEDESK